MVRGRVRDHDVVGSAQLSVPNGLGERVAHQAFETVSRERPLQQRTAAHGLADHPDRLARGPAQQVVGVGVEGVQVDDRERRIQVLRREVVPVR